MPEHRLWIGPMGAGKTNSLLDAGQALEADGARVLYVGHASDTRYGSGALRTHDGRAVPALMLVCLTQTLRPLEALLATPGRVALLVDEMQFFNHQAHLMGRYAAMGVTILASGLPRYATGGDFGEMSAVRAWFAANGSVVELSPACAYCGAPSTETVWEGAGSPGVGPVGPGYYLPACLPCWNQRNGVTR